jgi:hypothetical protein
MWFGQLQFSIEIHGVFRSVIVCFIEMVFDVFEREGGLVIVHVLLDLLPVAVAPDPERTSHDNLIHETPPTAIHIAIECSPYQILDRIFLQIGKAANAVVLCLGDDVGASGDVQFA